MDPLRHRTIRLAASLPNGSEARRLLLSALVSAAESPLDKFQSLVNKHKLELADVVDLGVFVLKNPMVGQPPTAITSTFKGWWGGKPPKPWTMSDKEIVALVEAYVGALPALGGLLAQIKDPPGKESKKAGWSKSAMVFTAIALAAATSQAHKSTKRYKAYREDRDDRASDRDPDYEPSSTWKATRFSQSENKEVSFEGTSEEYDEWAKGLEYEDYTWAKKQLGEEPKNKEGWSHDRVSYGSWVLDRAPSEAQDLYKNHRDVYVAHLVRAVMDSGKDDIKGAVEKRRTEIAAEDKAQYETERKRRLDRDFSVEEQKRLHTLIKEEQQTAGAWEKMLALVAPDSARAKAVERAKGRAEEEKAKGKAPRTYEDYLADKKYDNVTPPMSKEDWEAKYRS